MIKIIKKGADRKFRKTCPQCRTVFTYQANDIEMGYVTCPSCNQKLYVNCDDEVEELTAELGEFKPMPDYQPVPVVVPYWPPYWNPNPMTPTVTWRSIQYTDHTTPTTQYAATTAEYHKD